MTSDIADTQKSNSKIFKSLYLKCDQNLLRRKDF